VTKPLKFVDDKYGLIAPALKKHGFVSGSIAYQLDAKAVEDLRDIYRYNAVKYMTMFFFLSIFIHIWANSVIFTHSLNYIIYTMILVLRIMISAIHSGIGIAFTDGISRFVSFGLNKIIPK
jgi:hypothetical protein